MFVLLHNIFSPNRCAVALGITIVLFLAASSWLCANNIQVSGTVLSGSYVTNIPNSSTHYTGVQFNVTWENSWRLSGPPANWDAAWVFVKFRVGTADIEYTTITSTGTSVSVGNTAGLRVGMPVLVTGGTGALAAGTVIQSITNSTTFVLSVSPTSRLIGANIRCCRVWEHAYLNNDGHSAPIGATIDIGRLNPGSAFDVSTNPGVGAFIYRSSVGSGTTTFTSVRLRWNYGAQGVSDDAVIDVNVHALEMVYVPGGADFNVGGGGGASAFTTTTINTAAANTLPSGTGSLGGQAGGYPTGQTAPATASWPNGYASFYCMKHELTQGQYRDFLNNLTRRQQANRVETSVAIGTTSVVNTFVVSNTATVSNRNGLRCDTVVSTADPLIFFCDYDGNYSRNDSTDGQSIACNFLSWMDVCAYLDWAGLRPMTELEFEKICRGTLAAVTGEYAWGTASSAVAAASVANEGRSIETVNTPSANAVFGSMTSVQGPLRSGVFANDTTNRSQSGGSYYGVMELSGNVNERIVTLANADGRNYTGAHGNGMVSVNGHANVATWPGYVTSEVTGASGSGFRGGDWQQPASMMSVSNRSSASVISVVRESVNGIRGVRSAP